jgi:Zn-dependent peptidase ImmA (M78 family)
MVDSIGIYKRANSIVQTYGTRDTLKLAKAIGIDVVPVSCFEDLLGMYACKWKHRVMFINDRMDEYLTQMVVGHEMGHDIYHRELAKGDGLKEFELFRMQSHTEYEANAFAAHTLLSTKECLEYAREGYDVVQIAKMMNSEINLMLIKMQELIRLGYNLRLPIEPQSDFFKNIRAESKDEEW